MANPVLRMNTGAVITNASTIEEISEALGNDMKEVDAITGEVGAATKGAFSNRFVSVTNEVNADATKHSKKVGALGAAQKQAAANTQAVDQQNAANVRIQQI